MKYANNILELIGNTPIVRLNRIGSGNIFVKLEYMNPGGSVKDRPALSMIEAAEKDGRLKKGGTIVEPTSGNTGIGLAMAAAVKGYKAIFTMPDWMSAEKRKIMRAFGAEVVVTPTDVAREDPRSYYMTAKRIAREKNAFMPDQYENPANPDAHYKTTGPEIWAQTDGKIDAFVAGIGTGGTMTGIARYLKEKNPKIKIALVDPVGSIIGGGEPSQFFIEGIGHFFIPKNADMTLVDEVIKVEDEQAQEMAKRLAREEGILAGPSSGAAIFGAEKLAEKMGKNAKILALLPDSGERYLSYMHPEDEGKDKKGFATGLIHGDELPCAGSVVAPIFQTSTFKFSCVEQAKAVFDEGSEFSKNKNTFVYTRGSNPTLRALEVKMSALEYGEDAVVFSSGMAAISAAAMAFLGKGDHAIVTDVTYGETHHLFSGILARYGVEVSFADTSDAANVKKEIRENTKLIFVETPSNPLLRISDIEGIAKIKGKAMLAVDNTILTPYYQNPLKLGADIVVHSMTKYIGGHSDLLGGVAIGSAKDIARVRQMLYTTGAVLDPFAAWLTLRGLKTLELRMKKHTSNAMKVAQYLAKHPRVCAVHYTGLSSHPQHELIKRQMSGYGGLITFKVKGTQKEIEQILNSVKLCSFGVSLGAVETLIQHPASMTHKIVSEEHKKKIGIADDLIRLSVGIEDPDDIIADLKQAMEAK